MGGSQPGWQRPLLRALTIGHRWLGIAGGGLLLLWLLSGAIMLYARMPALDPAERLARLPALEPSTIALSPRAVARVAKTTPARVRIGTLGDRPIYRLAGAGGWTAVYADDGAPLAGLGRSQAIGLATDYVADCELGASRPARHEGVLERPDQWTLQLTALLPLHRVACANHEGTVVYVSDRTGEVVLVTTSRQRLWGYLGAVLHWLYFTPLRIRSALWLNTVIWLSIAGSVLALSGLVIGVWRVLRRDPAGRRLGSPYRGLLRFHHYAGLAFGLFTFTWALSGCLSMDPWGWGETSANRGRDLRSRIAGGLLGLERVELESLRDAAGALRRELGGLVELELVQHRGEPVLLAHQRPAAQRPRERRYGSEPAAFLASLQPAPRRAVRLGEAEGAKALPFTESELVAAARHAFAGARPVSVSTLETPDLYYDGATLPLPVVRACFADLGQSCLYLDPSSGLLVRHVDRGARLDRWLYQGLHSLDFPGLGERRLLRDAVALLLLAGGVLLVASTLAPGLRRVRRRLSDLARPSR